MKIRKLIVSQLFGHFEHVVPFNQDEGITILTAPNGYGKTVILKMLDAIFSLRFNYLLTLEFKKIELFTDSFILLIKKESRVESGSLIISVDGKHSEVFEYNHLKFTDKQSGMQYQRFFETILPNLTRIGSQQWADDRDGEILGIEEILEKYPELLPEKFVRDMKNVFPKWLEEIADSIKTYFIQDQRLILRSRFVESSHRSKTPKQYTDTIEKYAADLANHIRTTVVKSSQISQRLDSSFPVRLLRKDYNFNTLSVDELKKHLQNLQDKREKLASYNLLVSEDVVAGFRELNDIQETDTKVLTLYVRDTSDKLAVYDDMLKRVELFSDILNEKRLSFKKVKIDVEKGFFFETDNGQPLKLTQLSSGEQHQIVLLYELIFNVKENVLVLIDEPEISLHVAWQKEFLKDLKRIIEIQDMVVVIATHSPQIIDNRWELTVDLEEGDQA